MSPNAALALAHDRRMTTVHSDLLGALDVPDEEVIAFPSGLFGFPECRSFVLVPAAREGMYWLQSVEHGTLAFLLVDPFLFFDGYAVDLGTAERAELEVRDASDVMVLTIVTLPGSREELPTT
ncbi:MAG TPA: flagellar assembly protein FliW, partial [Longimicrobiaceae bacterium]